MAERLDRLDDDPKDKSFNEDLTARPKDVGAPGTTEDPGDLAAEPFDYGDMNETDAKASDYTDEEGHAVSAAKAETDDTKNTSTGAYTDLGEGRSSVIKRH